MASLASASGAPLSSSSPEPNNLYHDRFPPQNQTTIRNEENGIVTEIICTTYADRHFVVITQLKKFGTLISAWAEEKAGSMDGKVYEMKTLLGKRDDALVNVYARQIIERISTVSSKPLLLAIALQPEGRDSETFKRILNKLYEIATW